MVSKVVLACVQALMIQCIAGQCLNSRLSASQLAMSGPLSGSYLANGPFCNGPYGPGPFASDGGALPVSSSSLFPASGVSIVSENAFEGLLDVAGALPFLGTVSLEGALPTAGAGAVAYGCGNGEVAMLTEDIGGSRFGLPSVSLGYNAALAQPLSFGASSLAGGAFTGPVSFTNAGPFTGGLYANAPWAANNLGAINSYGPAAAAASNGGSLPVTSASVIPPNGVNILSDNAYEGALSVAGAMPFLGTVALEGALPTAGAGSVAYGCGNGEVAMLKEEFGASNFFGPYNMGYPGNNYGLCGCSSRI